MNGDKVSHDGKYWTVLILAPADFYDCSVFMPNQNTKDLLYNRLHRLPIVMLQRATEALTLMVEDWSKILDYADQLLGDQDLVLLPEKHDQLLEDDNSGSRSKKYFWVINSLTTFRAMMDESNQVYLRFRSAEIDISKPRYSGEEWQIIKEADKGTASFERLGKRADMIRGRATVLLNSVSIITLPPCIFYILKLILELAFI